MTLPVAEIPVPGAARQSIGIPHRGAATDPHGECQLGNQGANNRELLPVLFPQHEHRRPHQGKQATDHCGDAIEMPRPTSTAKGSLQRGGNPKTKHLISALGGDLLIGRTPERIGTGMLGDSAISVKRARIALEILTSPELEWIHVDTGQHGAGGLLQPTGMNHELRMALVQPAHRGHEMHVRLLLSTPGPQV